MEHIDLQSFADYLKDRELAPMRTIPFYTRWVERFLKTPVPETARTPKDQIMHFTDQLERSLQLEEWQIKQAGRAVELYLNQFMKAQNEKKVQKDPKSSAPAVEENEALKKVRELIRIRHYSYRTEQTYLAWVTRYLAYAQAHLLDWKLPDTSRSFLSHLATERDVASSTQNQAFNALLFLQREVLGVEQADLRSVRAKRGPRLPVVLTVDEVRRVLEKASGTKQLLLQLTYGAGLRVSEVMRLRVKDLDFDNLLVFVRDGKGNKDRSTLLPRRLVELLQSHLKKVKELHEKDLAAGHGAVYLPGALATKYPQAEKSWAWQYVFPSGNLSVDPRSGVVRRHHVGDKVLQSAMQEAVARSNLSKPASVHTLRHSFATHLLMKGVNIREIQQYLGHSSVETTMIYTHVIRHLSHTAESPLDEL